MTETDENPVDEPGFEALLEFLRDGRGFDFTGYKRASLGRRVRKRMDEVKVGDFTTYLDYVQAHPGEVASLFDTILINVTTFFRDPDHWDYLRDEVVSEILAKTPGDEVIRVWSAGCSSGEEAYTLAMIFCEVLGVDGFKDRVKIYATDIDNAALAQARRGVYDERQLTDLPEPYRERYFESDGTEYEFRRDIRRSVIFGRHDLVQDAPISRVDLMVCRNLLMYFTAETQGRILSRLHFALNDRGFLFLGRAEMLLTRTSLFAPHDLAHRVFTKSPDTLGARPTPRALAPAVLPSLPSRNVKLRDLTFLESPGPQLVIDVDGTVMMVNLAARTLFEYEAEPVGRAFSDLELSYRPIELRGHIDQAYRSRRTVRLHNVAHVTGDGEVRHLDISVTPLVDEDSGMLGCLLAFADVSEFERLRADLQRSNHDLETAYEELQSTNEELLTTNEELQSTIEELETTNEELQSANEELETMNEELQSSNLEQEEVNSELIRHREDLDEANAFLATILETLHSGVVVLTDDMNVRVWDRNSVDTWGLREDEVIGTPFEEVDCGLPVDDLMPVIRQAAEQEQPTRAQVVAINRLGRSVTCDVRAQPLRGNHKGTGGVVVLIDVAESEPKET